MTASWLWRRSSRQAGRDSVAAELSLSALRAVKHDSWRLVGQVGGPPVLGVLRHPRLLALGALEDGCGTFNAHSRQEVRGPAAI
jgi:hypothetical protein